MLTMVLTVIGDLLLGAALVGCGYMVAAGVVLRRFLRSAPAAPRRGDAVTLLKPLYGAEPRLADNLGSFLQQAHDGAVQLLCGVQRADDPAAAVVADLRAAHPGGGIDLVVDAAAHGANGKVANLINMAPAIRHDLVVLSDSDIAVAPDYLARLLAALDAPGVGVASCLYRGRGDAGGWSRFAAAGLSYQFLPGAAFGAYCGLAHPCMGSTIALSRATLAAIGGFAALRDQLADDYAIGEAVRALGLTIAVPPMLVVHGCDEPTPGAVWRHELRWAATVKGIAPGAYAASVIGLPLPLAVLGTLVSGQWAAGLAVIAAAVLVRGWLAWTVDRQVGEKTASLWLLPARDMFSFAVYLRSFGVRSVDWRGTRLHMADSGRVVAEETF